MKPTESTGFVIKRVSLTEKGVTYDTFRLTGRLNGQRIRRQFKSREEALGEKNRLEVQAANSGGSIRAVPTRLSEIQIAEAEACFQRLKGGETLSGVLDWYLANYRPPCVEKPLGEAIELFLAGHKPHVELVHWDDLRRRLTAFSAAFPSQPVHAVSTAQIETYLNGRGWAPKSFNNTRGVLHAFFDFCTADDRRWAVANPVVAVRQRKVNRGLPQIETAERIAELMAYVETFAGGPRAKHRPGCLAPYFVLCTFAGMRPSLPNGEVWKLGSAANVARLVNVESGIIHVTPEIAKTDAIRQVKIRPNLAQWLKRYPITEFPIVMPNMQAMVTDVRKRFHLTDDVLRHSFISNHVAKFKSLGDAALEGGNSESMIRRHYLNLVSEEDAEKFWSIVPKV